MMMSQRFHALCEIYYLIFMHIRSYLLRYLQITNFSTINCLNFTHLLGAQVNINMLLIFVIYVHIEQINIFINCP